MKTDKILVVAGKLALGGFVAVTAVSTTVGSAANAQGGVKVGSVLVTPRIELREYRNTNIYTTNTAAVSSYITQVKPSVSLSSQLDKHQLTINANVNRATYSHSSGDDYTDASGSASGRLDVWNGGGILLGASRSYGHENRGSDNNTDGIAPLKYNTTTLSGGLFQRKEALSVNVTYKRDSFKYNSVKRTGLADITNNDRDRSEDILSARVGYALSPQREIFVRGNRYQRNYDLLTDRSALKRNTDGYDVTFGVGIGSPGKFSGELAVGTMKHTFAETTFKDVNKMIVGASMEYLPSSTVAVRANASRNFSVATDSTASSLVSSSVGGHIDWMATRKLTVRPEISYTIQDYQTVAGAAQKEDKLRTAGLGFVYSVTPVFYGGGTYKFTKQTSLLQSSEYNQNEYMLKIGAKF